MKHLWSLQLKKKIGWCQEMEQDTNRARRESGEKISGGRRRGRKQTAGIGERIEHGGTEFSPEKEKQGSKNGKKKNVLADTT